MNAPDDIYDDDPELPWWIDDGYDGSSIDPGAGEPG